MASGKLGSARLSASTYTTISQCPANTIATVNVNLVNCDASASRKVRLAINTAADGATPGNADWIEFDTALAASAGIERTALVLSAGEKIVALADGAGVTVRAHGFEEGTA